MTNTAPTYEVAISFLSADEPLADHIFHLLDPAFKVFVYSRREEEVIGRDGYEQYSRLFRNDARIVVLLHREGWGTTPFTSVEEHAIKSRHFEGQYSWEYLLVVRTDDSPLPSWIPPYRIYYRIAGGSAEALAGHIANLAVEKGAAPRAARVRDQLEQRQRLQDHEGELDLFFRSINGKRAAEVAAKELFAVLERDLTSVPGVDADFRSDGTKARLEFERVAMGIRLRDADYEHPRPALVVTDFDGLFPTDLRGNYVRDVPNQRKRGQREYSLTQTIDGAYVWIPQRRNGELSAADLADELLRHTLRRADRVRR